MGDSGVAGGWSVGVCFLKGGCIYMGCIWMTGGCIYMTEGGVFGFGFVNELQRVVGHVSICSVLFLFLKKNVRT